MPGLGLGLALALNGGGGPPVAGVRLRDASHVFDRNNQCVTTRYAAALDYYVDSVNGSDASSGLTAAAAKQTIASLGYIFSGMRIHLARGASWREQLRSVEANVVVSAYGSGRLPILDGADVVAAGAWTKTAGRTNIWQATVTVPDPSGLYPSLWENAVRLRWIASLDLLDAESLVSAARFYVTLAATTITLYVNRDPTTNGKTYETAVRMYGVDLSGANCVVSDTHTKRQLHNNGSLVLTGQGSRADRCLAEDGTKHNLFIGANGVAEDCIAWKSDWADRTDVTAFVGFTSNGVGKTARFSRCIVVRDPAQADPAGMGFIGFYCHTSGAGQEWDTVTYDDCAVYGATEAYSVNDATNFVTNRCYADESILGFRSRAIGTVTVRDPWIKWAAGNTRATAYSFDQTSGAAVGSIEGLRCYVADTLTAAGQIHVQAGVFTSRRNVFARAAKTGGFGPGVYSTASGTVSSTYNITKGFPRGINIVGTSPEVDFNVYDTNSQSMIYNNIQYELVSEYRTANPTIDVGSVIGDPLLADPASGDFNLQGGSPAIALGAGLERPSITYTAIPSAAALAAL